MSTLSLAMIVKNEGDTIERVLGSARSFCDEIIVVDTGSTDDTVKKAEAMGAIVYHFDWIDDFSAARNFSFSYCTKDWIIWLDGDDFVTTENQQRILELKSSQLNDDLETIYLRYNYGTFHQWRERMIRRSLFGTQVEWRGAIHECIHGLNNEKVKYFPDISINHEPPPQRHAAKKDRNINIIRKCYQKGDYKNDERALFIYSVECLHSLLREEGEKVIAEFFAISSYSPYRYEIYCKMHDFYNHFEESQLALDALNKAMVEDPKRAEAYYKLGKYMLEKKNDPRGAIPLLHAASIITPPDYGELEIIAYTYGPWEALSQAYIQLEDFSKAKEAAKKALEYNSPNKSSLANFIEQNNSAAPTYLMPDTWLNWTKENLDRGCDPAGVRDILLQNNFTLPVIRKVMGERFPPDEKIISIDYEKLANVKLTKTATRIQTDLIQLCTIENFMSAKECDELVGLIKQRLQPSTITTSDTEPDKYFRTSSTCYLTSLKNPFVESIDLRIATTLGVHLSYSEEIQAQLYKVGQQFKPHTDYFEPRTKEYETYAKVQGNRTWTFMVYLNDTPKGGATDFPNIGKRFYPKKGMAVVWNNLDENGNPNPNTLHCGMPVEEGEKVIITKWFREKGSGPMFVE